MLNKILEDIAEQLRQSGQYRIINKYYKPEGYNTDSSTDKKLIGVFLDTETTGLSCVTDRIIELGMVKFEYTEDGEELVGGFKESLVLPESIHSLLMKMVEVNDSGKTSNERKTRKHRVFKEKEKEREKKNVSRRA
jgi:DNA polymerase III epsilon subunit-like protein